MVEVEAIILAAGFGSRLGDPFCHVQKCVLPIEGRPILGHILENLVKAFGSVTAYIGVGHKAETVVDYVSKNTPNKMNVAFIPGCDRGIPAAHLKMEPFINGDFVSLPGDVIALPRAYVNALSLFESTGADVSVVLSPRVDEADTHSVAKLDGIKVVELATPPEVLDPDHLRNVTIYGLDCRLFDFLRRHPVPEDAGFSYAFIKGFNEIDMVAVNYKEPWVHVAYQEDLAKKLP